MTLPAQDEASGAATKRYTPQASAALESHINNMRASIRLTAQRLSMHEEIVKDDVHAAIAEIMAPREAGKTWSDWLKWIGFFVLGVAVPTFISVINSEKVDKWMIVLLVASIIIGAATISASLVLDLSGSRPRKSR